MLEIALDLADALTRAHRLGIIHRDLKPANVLLAEDGTPRLTDFGIAHVSDSPRLTQAGILMGTVDYLSPEACDGEPIDERGDIWSPQAIVPAVAAALGFSFYAGESPDCNCSTTYVRKANSSSWTTLSTCSLALSRVEGTARVW